MQFIICTEFLTTVVVCMEGITFGKFLLLLIIF